MSRRPPVSTRTDTLFPFTALRRAESRPPCRQAAARDFAVVRRDREHHRPRYLFRGRPEAEAARCRIAPSRICREWPALSRWIRSEEHTSELQSLMRNSYAVFCLKIQQCEPHSSTSDQVKKIL